MCGIVAYLGNQPAQPILIEGLKRLEYRGYDSSGIGLINDHVIKITKSSGRISVLESMLSEPNKAEVLGIGHTRWATHGEPNTVNAHPHTDYTGKIALVHNGIIENYSALKTFLQSKGCTFKSETDTEVIANLIGYLYTNTDSSDCPHDGQNRFEWAVQHALNELVGTYGLAIVCTDFPDMIFRAVIVK